MKKIAKWSVVGLFALFAALQLVPYGKTHQNPPVRGEPAWPDAEVRALAQRACFDCHSNETQWTWYSYVAPASWLVERDVMKGRSELNFSEWTTGGASEAEEASEAVLEGEMPMPIYTLIHRDAVLTPAERLRLAQGLDRLVAQEPEHDEGPQLHVD